MVRVRYVKVAEYQARGVVHFHAIIRLDARPPDHSSDVAPPPPEFTAAALARAATDAASKVRVPIPEAVRGQHGDTFGWGRQLDVHEITHTPEGEAEGSGELTEGQVAAYISKYATKSTETCGGADRPIHSEHAIDHAKTTPHVKALMRACWRLGGTDGLQPAAAAGLDPHARLPRPLHHQKPRLLHHLHRPAPGPTRPRPPRPRPTGTRPTR